MNNTQSPPRTGMFAFVRNRHGVISTVDAFDSTEGRFHLVAMDYSDELSPASERLLWEMETSAKVLEPNALPNFEHEPMQRDEFDAILQSARWNAKMPIIDPKGEGRLSNLPLSAPFHGAFEVEDYQMVPVLKALTMPRISMLIADDVGLGKTIEAGLILNELLLRRRIRKVLILTPASLRHQWQHDELWGKFHLHFDIVDRQETIDLKKRMGMDANPWRSYDRIIASYHYLRQPDVLEQFLSASHTPDDSPNLPWDLLIVDECHNLMPAPMGEDSDLTQMLRKITPLFEHRIFLSATPHNGHTYSFLGLLEILDPVRFSRSRTLSDRMRQRVRDVVVRRLKRQINSRTTPPKFSQRLPPVAMDLEFSDEELQLTAAFGQLREGIRRIFGRERSQRSRTAQFAIEMLGKRLLSCPTAFAESWRRARQGFSGPDAATEGEVDAARKLIEQETDDDREAEARLDTASGVIGAWLKPLIEDLLDEITDIDHALSNLGFDLLKGAITEQDPFKDARLDCLIKKVEELLLDKGQFRADERIVIFTEYKTTLDYLLRRFISRFGSEPIVTLFGGMDDRERDVMKNAFNDGTSPARILLATDAAAEGLNLQRHARYLVHFDCPWNPSRLEQRNGRVDRHGQPRDVSIFYFTSRQDFDLQFLSRLLSKANDIREDLGSANELFDEAAHRRLVYGEENDAVLATLDERVRLMREHTGFDADDSTEQPLGERQSSEMLQSMASEIDFDGMTMRQTLETAMSLVHGRPQLDCEDTSQTCRILHPDLGGWSEVIDQSLRRISGREERGPLMRLAFSPKPFLEQVGPRMVFHPRPDTQFIHLGHPMMQRAGTNLIRRRFPGTGHSVSRWCVSRGPLPVDAEALILLSVEEIAINNLRETIHHWVRTVAFPIVDGRLGDPLPHQPARAWRIGLLNATPSDTDNARDIADEVNQSLKEWISRHRSSVTEQIEKYLGVALDESKKKEESRYRSRQAEVSELITNTVMDKLERDIAALRIQRNQGLLFDQAEAFDKMDRSIEEKREELARQQQQHALVRDQLKRDFERIVQNVIPKRYSLSGEVLVYPLTMEIRLPS